MNTNQPIWLSDADCASLLTLKDALAALEQGLLWEGQGEAHNVPKAMGRWGEGTAMHCLGAMFPKAGFVGWKTWAITKGGGAVTYELFDANSGALLAIMQGVTLGQMRTASMTGLGTRWLSAPDADTLGIVGVGRQAVAQVAAIAAVRPLRKVWVNSRSEERREAFAQMLRKHFSFEVVTTAAVEEAVGQAAITTLITRAEQPFLTAAMLPRGAHLNAVGAILPTHAEFTQDVFERADLIAVDSVPDTRKNSKEFIERFGASGDADWSSVHALGELVAGKLSRPAQPDLTLFKSMGMGISDLSVASEIYRRALQQGVGIALAVSPPGTIRWA
jgi:ornithine cyclodeaminase